VAGRLARAIHQGQSRETGSRGLIRPSLLKNLLPPRHQGRQEKPFRIFLGALGVLVVRTLFFTLLDSYYDH
jgi:hypothetical protein